jgi:hypothetical protein
MHEQLPRLDVFFVPPAVNGDINSLLHGVLLTVQGAMFKVQGLGIDLTIARVSNGEL